jgi:hypothetical protein
VLGYMSEYLEYGRGYEIVRPLDFYREIFPEGELEEKADREESGKPIYDNSKHKYTGIVCEIAREGGKQKVRRYSITDDLDILMDLQKSKHFCFLSPISYIGKTRESKNARLLYAMCVEIDNILLDKNGYPSGLHDLFYQFDNEVHPTPTYTVLSGSGVHLYYVFEEPIALFKSNVKSLERYKRKLTRRLWNKYVTTTYTEEKIQYESLFQGFRLVGGVTKRGGRTVCFKTGEKVTVEYMNSGSWVYEKDKIVLGYEPNSIGLKKAKKKYPEWYQKRIVEGQPKGRWTCDRAVYDWWKNRISEETTVGHRYYALMCLCIYAIKCEISREELEKDCFSLMEHFESITDKDDNHFTEKDVMDALQSFEDKGYVTYPINSISNRSGIPIEKNKRNGLKQNQHLYLARRRKEDMKAIDLPMKAPEGRPKGSSKQRKIVFDWRMKNPNGKKADCIRETGLNKKTVYRWWDF